MRSIVQVTTATTLPQVCPSCNQPYKDGETCKAGRGGCPMGGDL